MPGYQYDMARGGLEINTLVLQSRLKFGKI